ncbi:hexokinase [Aureobasidium subglaciale]|nr:hexokinase [Aureobasidium subglaciale]
MNSVNIVRGDSPIQTAEHEKLPPLNDKLASEVEKLKELFRIDQQKLKDITKRFEVELDEGLKENNKNIPMNITWVLGQPHGDEKGSFLTVDLGGTNLRVCWITLPGARGKPSIVQEKYQLSKEVKTGTADQLWDEVADRMETFIRDQKLDETSTQPLPLGFTFSYPAMQEYIDHGILQTWTKGWDVKGVEGEDVTVQLRKAMDKRKLPVKLVALINDTTGAMIASAYHDPETIIGAIFGTGCNAAYMEDSDSIPKSNGRLPSGSLVAINCEYGAFDNDHHVLPMTKYDHMIDAESPRPGEQAFEKMSAGLYLGEIFRLVLVDLARQSLIFTGQDISRLEKSYILDTGFLSAIEDDQSPSLENTATSFKTHTNITLKTQERLLCHRLAELVATRGARLCACGIAAICSKKKITHGHVAADGSVANKHPKFKRRWADALAEILGWSEDRRGDDIVLTPAEDGSGIGAAVIVAMTLERARMGEDAGVKEAADM